MNVSQCPSRTFHVGTQQVNRFAVFMSLFGSRGDDRFDQARIFLAGHPLKTPEKVFKQIRIAQQQSGFCQRGKNVRVGQRHRACFARSATTEPQLQTRIGNVLADAPRKLYDVVCQTALIQQHQINIRKRRDIATATTA